MPQNKCPQLLLLVASLAGVSLHAKVSNRSYYLAGSCELSKTERLGTQEDCESYAQISQRLEVFTSVGSDSTRRFDGLLGFQEKHKTVDDALQNLGYEEVYVLRKDGKLVVKPKTDDRGWSEIVFHAGDKTTTTVEFWRGLVDREPVCRMTYSCKVAE